MVYPLPLLPEWSNSCTTKISLLDGYGDGVGDREAEPTRPSIPAGETISHPFESFSLPADPLFIGSWIPGSTTAFLRPTASYRDR